MKDLTGYLKKILSSFSLVVSFLLFFSPSPILAQESFSVSTSFEHTLSESIINTEALVQITTETPRVFSYYTISIPLKNLDVDCKSFATNQPLDCDEYYRGSYTDILINFNNAIARPNSPLEVVLTYSTPLLDSGNTYIYPSQIMDSETDLVVIKYPKELGEPTSSSDAIQKITSLQNLFEVTIEKPSYKDVSLLFGESIVYEFEINKVFSNTLGDQNQTFELYVPSDDFTQIIVWDEITPLPNISISDSDNNYIFKYIVAPNKTIDCQISGYIIKTEAKQDQIVNTTSLTSQTGHWTLTNSSEKRRVLDYLAKKGINSEDLLYQKSQMEDTQIQLINKYLYEYTLDRIQYKDSVELGTLQDTRLGTNTLLESPTQASVVDYADFYISLLREYGIPARLVVGFVSNISGYTSDGFYHQWVEYYDLVENRWKFADPFLEEYFEKKLYGDQFSDHIAILRRGKSSVAPKLSFFNDNDFLVTPSKDSIPETNFLIDTQLVFENAQITDRYIKGLIYLSNKGNIALNSYSLKNSNISEVGKYLDPVNNTQSLILLPKQNTNLQLNIPFEEITSENTFIAFEYQNYPHMKSSELLESEFQLSTPISIRVLSKLLSISIFSLALFLIYLGIRLIKRKNG